MRRAGGSEPPPRKFSWNFKPPNRVARGGEGLGLETRCFGRRVMSRICWVALLAVLVSPVAMACSCGTGGDCHCGASCPCAGHSTTPKADVVALALASPQTVQVGVDNFFFSGDATIHVGDTVDGGHGSASEPTPSPPSPAPPNPSTQASNRKAPSSTPSPRPAPTTISANCTASITATEPPAACPPRSPSSPSPNPPSSASPPSQPSARSCAAAAPSR